MKKVFAMLLTLTLALSLMAGCGASKTEEQPAESSDTQTEQPAQTETQLSGALERAQAAGISLAELHEMLDILAQDDPVH